MRTAKYILTAVILAIAVIAALVAANWQHLLSPEQKLRYGLVFAATDDYAAAARENPTDPQALRDYVDVLVRRGNLGRAYYVSQLYGVEHEGLAALRVAIEKSIEAGNEDKAYALGDDPAMSPYLDDPLRQAIRYAEGYRHALLGDWMSAKNHFNAIDPAKLAPELRPFRTYYLARSYRLAGDEAEQAQVEGLLRELCAARDPALSPRAAYNLVAWYLEQPDADENWSQKYATATAGLKAGNSVWAEQKIAEQVGRKALAEDSPVHAMSEAAHALGLGTDEASAKGICELMLDALDAALAAANASEALLAGYRPGSLTTLAQTVGRLELDQRTCEILEAVSGKGALPGENQDKSTAFNNEKTLASLIAWCRAGDTAHAAGIIADGRFSNLPPQDRATGYYHYAQALQNKQQWNDALRQYQRVIDLKGDDASRAHLARYEIVKRVQDPFDVREAIAELEFITKQHGATEEYAKAVEELIPLLIFAGQKGEATALANEATEWTGGPDIAQRTVDQLHEVGLYWKGHVLQQDSGSAVADIMRRDMPVKYWNYYELTTAYPPQPELVDTPLLLDEPESPGEYLAGLGLTWAASEYYDAVDDAVGPGSGAGSQLLMFFELANGEVGKSTASQQWDATEMLESGAVRERPLLEYVLRQAYPMPFSAEIADAARQSGVDPALIYAVIKKETNFRADSVSWAGAQGLMQLMPDTARWLNNRYGLGLDMNRVMEPAVNIRLGAAYLKSLQDDLGESNVRAVIHAYNGGPGNYRRWRAQYPVNQVLFTDLVPNEENETFAKKVIKYYKVYDWLLSDGTLGAD